MDDGTVEGGLLVGAAGRRPAQELCATDYAEVHGLPEADHRDSKKDREEQQCRTCASTASDFRVDYICWVSMQHGKNSATGGVRRAAASAIGGTRTESLSYRTAWIPARRRVPSCGRTSRRAEIASWVRSLLQEQGRLNTTNETEEGHRVNNNEAVNIGDLEKNSEAIKVVKPPFRMQQYEEEWMS